MHKGLFLRLLFCIAVVGSFLYAYINQQNAITELRLNIPIACQKLESIEQENTRLQFELDQLENPQRLMEIAREPQFSHLKYPLLDDIVTIEVP